MGIRLKPVKYSRNRLEFQFLRQNELAQLCVARAEVLFRKLEIHGRYSKRKS